MKISVHHCGGWGEVGIILAMKKGVRIDFTQLIWDLFLSEPPPDLSSHLISDDDRDRFYFKINEVRIYLPHKKVYPVKCNPETLQADGIEG